MACDLFPDALDLLGQRLRTAGRLAEDLLRRPVLRVVAPL